MLDRLKRFRKPLLVLLALALIGIVIIEIRFQVFRTSPPIDRTALMERPAIQVVVLPEHAPEFLHRFAEKRAGRGIPRWLFNRFMAYELGTLLSEDAGDQLVHVVSYASLPHTGGFVAAQANKRGAGERVPEIEWSSEGPHLRMSGQVVMTGLIDMDVDAADAVFFQWGEGRRPAPLEVSGDHFFEMVFDNRAGQAYLAMASMMTAFDFELDPNDTDITLSSFQFVITARVFVDVVGEDTFEIAMDFEIEPEARNRMGVINLKGGIDELFSELGKDLRRDHGVEISGGSDWNENVIEFRYTINSASGFLEAMMDRD